MRFCPGPGSPWPHVLAATALLLGCGRDAPSSGVADAGPPPPATWVRVPAGSFLLGSPNDEPCRDIDEAQRKVTLTRALMVWPTEVTQGQYSSRMGYNPATFGPRGVQRGCESMACPVEEVTWHEAAAYCNALSTSASLTACYACTGTGRQIACKPGAPHTGASFPGCPGFRLPTEAEWEYMYRAGTTTSLYNGTPTDCGPVDPLADAIAWFRDNSGKRTHRAAEKMPNAWGLHDMGGNVWEWTNDWGNTSPYTVAVDPVGPATGSLKITRGGSWSEPWPFARAARREHFWPEARANYVGFRCVRSVK